MVVLQLVRGVDFGEGVKKGGLGGLNRWFVKQVGFGGRAVAREEEIGGMKYE